MTQISSTVLSFPTRRRDWTHKTNSCQSVNQSITDQLTSGRNISNSSIQPQIKDHKSFVLLLWPLYSFFLLLFSFLPPPLTLCVMRSAVKINHTWPLTPWCHTVLVQSKLTAKGSACSQEMGKPQDVRRILSGSDSGTTKNTKAMSATAITVATRTTRLSPYCADRYAPMAGLVTRLAAKVAETWRDKHRREEPERLRTVPKLLLGLIYFPQRSLTGQINDLWPTNQLIVSALIWDLNTERGSKLRIYSNILRAADAAF